MILGVVACLRERLEDRVWRNIRDWETVSLFVAAATGLLQMLEASPGRCGALLRRMRWAATRWGGMGSSRRAEDVGRKGPVVGEMPVGVSVGAACEALVSHRL